MPLKSKLKIEKPGVLAVSIFYVVVGGAEALILAFSNFTLVHVGPLAVLSLLTAYGLIRMKKWSVLLAVILFFPAITFGATNLYASVIWRTFYPSLEILLFHLALIVYLILAFITVIYVMAVRKNFE
ncbi:MAG: hypothetical protein OEX76_02365 [Candidatus Bathyarchaeota archaeon]|nr:hypothetical protein [Candidatus Bathyarchaeota archaeon]MDH5532603.1 hypothetical protein [Candidatus Bathyarchaeota archaeon]MDH5713723.1 hypothetical protein [Candidatus Bathyarchaeota archaeon]